MKKLKLLGVGTLVLLMIVPMILAGCSGTAYALDYPRNVRVEDGIVRWDAVTHEDHEDISYQVRWKTAATTMTHDWENVDGTSFDPVDFLGGDLPAYGQSKELEVRAIAPSDGVSGMTLVQTYYSRWVAVTWTR